MSANAIVRELSRRREENKLAYFDPYIFQRRFFHARDAKGRLAHRILLRAGNKTGKTCCAGIAAAYHATGLYPDDWAGIRFKHANLGWAGGDTIPNTRDLVQAELLGEPGNDEAFGTGSIPKHLIGRITKYHGIPDAIQSVLVKNVDGKWSKIVFKAFEQGKKAWMGKANHWIWLDEEPDWDIYSQCLRATLLYDGLIFITATPETGMSKVISNFSYDITGNAQKSGQCLITAEWKDVKHLSTRAKEEMLEDLLPYEREMREKGLPVMGSGLIFQIPEDDIICDPFPIPDDWEHIAGIDFGGIGKDSHPTAMAVFAIDPSTGISYLYDTYRENARTIPEHWLSMERIGNIPVAWPHDGLVGDRGSGISYKEQYEERGANMLPDKFSNPPSAGEDEGKGGNGVKAGLIAMYSDMKMGKFKVFSNQSEWFGEFRNYYMKPTKNGVPEIVKEGDDLMSATRYAYMSKRFAQKQAMNYGGYMPEDDYYQDSMVAY